MGQEVGADGPLAGRELRARGRETMARLLAAGAEVVGRQGLHATRVDDVVRAAATSHGTFYRYFSSKEDLFAALAAEAAADLAALADELGPLTADAEGRAALVTWVARFREVYDRHGAVILAWTEAERDGSTTGRLGTDLLGRFAARLAERIRAAGVTGIDPDVAALALVAMVERTSYFTATRLVRSGEDPVTDLLATAAQRALFGADTRT